MIVAIVQSSGLVSVEEVRAAVRAVQRQVNEHLLPAWKTGADLLHVPPGAVPPDDAWCVQLVDTTDQRHIDGYHSFGDKPNGVVGVKTSQDDGCPWTTTLSHEVLELIVDPWATVCMQVENQIYMLEICDPVEGQPYVIDGVQLEDFVLPAYYRKGSAGPWNYNPQAPLTGALTLASGGYSNQASLGAWSQENAARVRTSKRAPGPLSRRTRRLRPRGSAAVAPPVPASGQAPGKQTGG